MLFRTRLRWVRTRISGIVFPVGIPLVFLSGRELEAVVGTAVSIAFRSRYTSVKLTKIRILAHAFISETTMSVDALC
jgi:uncharacterized membrane protein YidH (DUF202 family)